MTDDKTRRRETANRIRVKASPGMMDRKAFEARYIEQHVVIGREEIEARCQEMFCDQCAESYAGKGAELLRTLHVTIDDDPLQNFWKLARLKCFGCGFEEIVPLNKPNFKDAPDVEAAMDVWERERRIFHENLKKEREQHLASQRMQQAQNVQSAHHLQQLAALAGVAPYDIQQMVHDLQNTANALGGEQAIVRSLRERILGKKS